MLMWKMLENELLSKGFCWPYQICSDKLISKQEAFQEYRIWCPRGARKPNMVGMWRKHVSDLFCSPGNWGRNVGRNQGCRNLCSAMPNGPLRCPWQATKSTKSNTKMQISKDGNSCHATGMSLGCYLAHGTAALPRIGSWNAGGEVHQEGEYPDPQQGLNESTGLLTLW